MFAVLNPSGRAGCDERESSAVLNSAEELSSLFHDGEVSCEVHVVYAVEAELLESCNHLTFCVSAGLIAEAFADRSAYGGCAADSNVLCGICDSVEDLLCVVLFVESTNGASNDTLTAVDTCCFSEILFECASDLCVVTAVNSTDRADTLELFTSSYAAAAEDTLVIIANDGNGGSIEVLMFLLCAVAEAILIALIFLSEILEFAVCGTDAGEALLLVSGKNELDIGLSCCSDLGSVCLDLHTVVNGIYASGNKAASALNFNEAETARADLVYILEVAKCGDVDVRIFAGFKYGDTCGYGIINTVNFYI